MSDLSNILWLTLDSVRYDHTTMGGYGRKTTLHIQSIADRSDRISFSSCFFPRPILTRFDPLNLERDVSVQTPDLFRQPETVSE